MRHAWIGFSAVLWTGTLSAASTPEAWSHRQTLIPSQGGLAFYPLPDGVLDRAQPDLRDLRLFDAAGREVPFAIDRRVRSFLQWENLRFTARLDNQQTVLEAEVPPGAPVDALRFDSPEGTFLKSATVETWDGGAWRALAVRRPVYRRRGIAEDRDILFPARGTSRLRLVLDDAKSDPLPVTGLWAHRETPPLLGTEPVDAKLLGREEGPTETRWKVGLPARNVFLDRLEVTVSDPLFQRGVRAVVRRPIDPTGAESAVTEDVLGTATLSRWPNPGGPALAVLSISIGRTVSERELELVVADGDNPRLTVTGVRAQTVPARLVFFSETGEAVVLAVGNPQAVAPRYDVERMQSGWIKAPWHPVRGGPLEAHPGHRPPEILPEAPDTAASFDPAGWGFRAPVTMEGPGVQRLVVPPAVLSRAADQGRDLRLVEGGRQIPFIYDRRPVYLTEAVSLQPLPAPAGRPSGGVSRWEVLLPGDRWPLSHLEVRAAETFFSRTVHLWEERPGPGGTVVRRGLAWGQWDRTADRSPRLLLAMAQPPESRRLVLEVEDGDNAPLTLETARGTVRTFALLFKTKADRAPMLYYGNPRAGFPRYDLVLAAPVLLSADKRDAAVGPEELLRSRRGAWGHEGKTGPLFWAVLAGAVVLVLFVIGRLLPEEQGPPSGSKSQ